MIAPGVGYVASQTLETQKGLIILNLKPQYGSGKMTTGKLKKCCVVVGMYARTLSEFVTCASHEPF